MDLAAATLTGMFGLFVLFAIALALLVALLTTMLVRDMRRPPRHTAAYAIARGMSCDPGDLDLTFEEWMLDRPDGAILPVWEIETKARTRSGTEARSDLLTAVFVHGWGHSRIDSLARIEPFRSSVDRIVLYDLRGHGDSQHCLSRLGCDEHLDLLALLERLGNTKFLLIGHSMGAVIAMHAAMYAIANRHSLSTRIAGIIAYAPYCEFHASLRGRLGVAGYPGRPITDLALVVQRWCGIHPPGLRDADVRMLSCPMLIVHGENDAVAPIADARRIAATASHATLIEIPGAAHVDAHRFAPATHDSAVRDFIAHLEPTPMGASATSSI